MPNMPFPWIALAVVGAALVVIGVNLLGKKKGGWWGFIDPQPGAVKVIGMVAGTLFFWYGFATLIGWVGENLPPSLKITIATEPWVRVVWNVVALIAAGWVSALLMWPSPPDPDYTKEPPESKLDALLDEIRQTDSSLSTFSTGLRELEKRVAGLEQSGDGRTEGNGARLSDSMGTGEMERPHPEEVGRRDRK